jgi:hypothetical protein
LCERRQEGGEGGKEGGGQGRVEEGEGIMIIYMI